MSGCLRNLTWKPDIDALRSPLFYQRGITHGKVEPDIPDIEREREMQPTTTTEQPGLRVTPIDWDETVRILGEKYEGREHWIAVVHASAVPLIVEIEEKY